MDKKHGQNGKKHDNTDNTDNKDTDNKDNKDIDKNTDNKDKTDNKSWHGRMTHSKHELPARRGTAKAKDIQNDPLTAPPASDHGNQPKKLVSFRVVTMGRF